MRKHVCYYLKGMPNASEIRNEINHLESKEEVIERLTEFFSDK
jgi:tRNA-dihydrouridine synthase B